MSARDLILPDSALQQRMLELRVKVDKMARRGTWSGAVRSTYANLNLVYDETDFDYTGGLVAVPDVVTLDLDPGRWVFMGMVRSSIATSDPGGVFRAGLSMAPAYTIDGARTELPTGLTGYSQDAPPSTVDTTLYTVNEVYLDVPWTATLDSGAQAIGVPFLEPTSVTWTIHWAQIIAYPG